MFPKIDHDAMHRERSLPPYSGALLGALCKAFDLHDEGVVGSEPEVGGKYAISIILSPNRDTTVDYFRGKRPVKPATELEILEAVGRGLLRSRVLPRLRLTLPAVEATPADADMQFYLLGLRNFLESWDAVRGGVASMSASVSDVKLTALPFLRLFGIDLAIRLSALTLLAGQELQEDGLPAWATEKGRNWLLNQWLKRAGSRTPKPAELSRRLSGNSGDVAGREGMSPQAVGNWLDGTKQPTAEHQVELAEVFTGLIEGSSKDGLLAEIRRFYGLWQLCSMLAKTVGWQVVEDTAARICRYVVAAQGYIRKAGNPADPLVQQSLVSNLWMGIWKPGGEHGNASLTGFLEPGTRLAMRGPWTRIEQDPVWKTDLYVCGKAAKLISGHEGMAMQYGVANQYVPFIERVQLCYQRAAGWEAARKIVPNLASQELQHPFDRQSAFMLMNSYYAFWPDDLRQPWERLSSLHPVLAANQLEQMAADEQFWGNYELAVELFQESVRYTPDDAYKVFRLGALYGEVGEIEKARSWLQKACDLEPAWLQPTLEFGRILLHVGQAERALAHLQTVPEVKFRDHVFGQYLLGHAHASNGNLRDAANAFRRLTELQRDNAGAYAEASLRLLEALLSQPEAADRKEVIEECRRFAKEADLRGDGRALKAWEDQRKRL